MDNAASKAIDTYVKIEIDRLAALNDLTKGLIIDRVKQDPTDLSVDLAAGTILGALSEAARAAKAAIARGIILKGGEDPGWGH